MSTHSDDDKNAKKQAIINAISERINILKNPEEIIIDAYIDEKCRDKIYDKLHKKDRNKILSLFVQCGGIKPNECDFSSVSEKKRLEEIERLENKIDKLKLSMQ